MPTSRKLCLIVVDSLRTDMLLRAVADDLAPNFAALLERGTLIGDCVSAFPSVTPGRLLGDRDRRRPGAATTSAA